jgi:hypothetical protein
MHIFPENQTETGIGNKSLKGRSVLQRDVRSFHLCYLNEDGSPYSGSNSVTLSISVSNESVVNSFDIKFPVKMTEIILNAATPTFMKELLGNYRNIIISIDAITDGQVSAYHFPEALNEHWR